MLGLDWLLGFRRGLSSGCSINTGVSACLDEPFLVLPPVEPQNEALLAGVDYSVSPEYIGVVSWRIYWSGQLENILEWSA